MLVCLWSNILLLCETPLEVSKVLGKDARIKIKNAAVSGSLRIKGARFDEILLDKYKQTLEADSADVELFAPANIYHKGKTSEYSVFLFS